ncbi:MAG: hypothetical protein ACXWJT_13530 [Xanthobacteraceae bacterium]
MRVLVTGGYGLIGSACLARLHRDGFEVVGAIVNCVGVLQDGARDDVETIQSTATIALFDACARAGIRVVHISAVGLEGGGTSFSSTKAAADHHLQSLDSNWVILKLGLVLAPAVYGGTAILRGLAGIPVVTPLVEAESRLQVVGIDDVVQTIALCLKPTAPTKVTWELAHPQILPLETIVRAVRQWLGFRPHWFVRLPRIAGNLIALFADALGWLGWRSAARSTTLAQLARGIVGDPAAWIAATGLKPQALYEILDAQPATVQDRWFARLYWIKPFAIAILALNWVFAGIPAFLETWESNFSLLGVPNSVRAALIVDAALSVIVGICVCIRPTARAALVGMIALSLAEWLVFGNLPTRPLRDVVQSALQALSAILAPLFVLAILDER